MIYSLRVIYQSKSNPSIECEIVDLDNLIQDNPNNDDYKEWIKFTRVIEITAEPLED